MRIICQTMSYWNSEKEFLNKLKGDWSSLARWNVRVRDLFNPIAVAVCSGTWSKPYRGKLQDSFEVVNAGVTLWKPYDCRWWNYSLSAWEAGFNWAMNRNDWDMIVQLDTETLVGAVDFNQLLYEFESGPEIVLSPSWCGCWIGGPLIVFKRIAVEMWLNHRLRANLIDKETWPHTSEEPMLPEEEMTRILGEHWWNPWKHLDSCRQDYGEQDEAHKLNEEVMSWPFVRKPHPDIVENYIARNTVRAIPVR